tara:strand:- start:909 stop:3542 length:2634 start_codon:yes stop_codon:yes gene_type:complete
MNVVEQIYKATQQRDALINQMIKNLMAVNDPKVIREQIAYLKTLGVNARAFNEQANKLAVALGKKDSEYVIKLKDYQSKLAIQRSKAGVDIAKIKSDASVNARKYAMEKSEGGLRGSEGRAQKLATSIKEVNAQNDQPTSEAFKQVLKQQFKDIYGSSLPTDPIARAKALDEALIAFQNVVNNQQVWMDKSGRTIPTPNFDVQEFFNEITGAKQGVTYGAALDEYGVLTGKSVAEENIEKYVQTVENDIVGGGGVDLSNYDVETAMRLGFTGTSKDPMIQAIATATFNKLQVENPKALGDIKTVDELTAYLFTNATQNAAEEQHEILTSAAKEVGNSIRSLNTWTDDQYVSTKLLAARSERRHETLEGRLTDGGENTLSRLEATQRAQKLYISTNGTRLERNTSARQQLLKEEFDKEQFFEMSYQDQKAIIDGLSMPKKFRKEFKALIQGKGGRPSASDKLEMLERVDQMLDEARDQGQIMPPELQKALEKQFEARGLLVRTKPKFGQGKGTVGYQIGGVVVPQGQLKYQDLVGMVGSIVKDGGFSEEEETELAKNLSEYAKYSLTGGKMDTDALKGLKTFAVELSKYEPAKPVVVTPGVVEEVDLPVDEIAKTPIEIAALEEETTDEAVVVEQPTLRLGVNELTQDQIDDPNYVNPSDVPAAEYSIVEPVAPVVEPDLIELERQSFAPSPAQSTAPTGMSPQPFAPSPAQSQPQVRSSDFRPQAAQSTAPTSDRPLFESTQRLAEDALTAITGGSADSAQVQAKGAADAQALGSIAGAITTNASGKDNITITPDVASDVFKTSYESLGNKKLNPVLDDKATRDKINEWMFAATDATPQEVHEGLSQIVPDMVNNQDVQDSVIAYYTYVKNALNEEG